MPPLFKKWAGKFVPTACASFSYPWHVVKILNACCRGGQLSTVLKVKTKRLVILHRGVGRKIFGGFPNGVTKTAGGLEGTARPDTEGYIPFLHYFCGIFYCQTNDVHKNPVYSAKNQTQEPKPSYCLYYY